jgi:hypothetical protein
VIAEDSRWDPLIDETQVFAGRIVADMPDRQSDALALLPLMAGLRPRLRRYIVSLLTPLLSFKCYSTLNSQFDFILRLLDRIVPMAQFQSANTIQMLFHRLQSLSKGIFF